MKYTCPMHPEVQEDHPGHCPECGMNLVRAQTNADKNAEERRKNSGHGADKHAGHSTRMFLIKFWVSLILTIPVVLYSELPMRLFGWAAPSLEISNWKLEIIVPFLAGTIIFFYCGWVFLAGAWRELRGKAPGMMTLIGLAVSAAYLYSVFSVFLGLHHDLFWELATLITIMLLGHWLEMKAVQSAQGALKELSKLLPDTAEILIQNSNFSAQGGSASGGQLLITNYQTKVIPLSELKAGDQVMIRPGGRVPADGTVVSGESHVDESLMTGESKPVAKKSGDAVIAGSVNADGSLIVKVAKIGEGTFLAGVMRLVKEAQESKSRLQILSDRAAYYLTIIAITTGVITFIAWILAKAGIGTATERLVAVLVITCPHALGLAIPLVASISTTLAARHGFLVRDRLALELARKVNVVLFDKTGTLTKGSYGVTKIISNSQFLISNEISNDRMTKSEDEILRLAAAVDTHSEHFVARAIVSAARERGLSIPLASGFLRLAGKGVRGMVRYATRDTQHTDQEVEVFAGGEAILAETNSTVPEELHTKAKLLANQGQTLIYVICDQKLLGIIALADLIREESREAIQGLKAMGIKTAMVTGDSSEVATWVAKDLGLDEYFARVLPEDKAKKVKLLQERGMTVAMVGDGINDAPALTQADVGIAVGAGTNVAIESAGIILVRNDPRDIAKIIRLSRATYRKMVQNLFWATGYNVVALPLAAGVFAFAGIILQPALSAAFMSLSTVIVAFNAVLLRRAKL